MATPGVQQGMMATQFGMINNLRTGNLVVDTFVCFLVPIVISFAMNNATCATSWLKDLWRWYFKKEKKNPYLRTIEFVDVRNSWGSRVSQSDEKNNILQKAITLFLTKQDVNYDECDLNLTAVRRHNRYAKSTNDDDDQDPRAQGEDIYGNTATQLRMYQLNRMPPPGKTVKIAHGIHFKQSSAADNPQDDKKKQNGDGNTRESVSSSRIVFEFSSTEPNGRELIEEYIKTAYNSYVDEIERTARKDKSRYYYMPALTYSFSSSSEDNNQKEAPAAKYKRYRLSENKTFRSLFFPEKDSLLSLVDKFLSKTGKYEIEGYPHKLGLLLHGPPGTGKTSLIKALAQYTKRNIVSIPLAKVRTNQQLMDMILDHRFAVQGEDLAIKLSFKNTIFVMEDIDCASSIVLKRTTAEQMHTIDDSDSDSDSIRLPKEPLNKQSVSSTDDSPGFSSFLKSIVPDKLDLSGILNVLDGVVDCPERLLIMTTNHPEKLDPALIRPGRIDIQLELGYMTTESAVDMIQHYYRETVSEELKDLISSTIANGCKVTPATLEQLCAENDSIAELVVALPNVNRSEPFRVSSKVLTGTHSDPCRVKSGV